MTIKGWGLKRVEFEREKDNQGIPDPKYTGRFMHLTVESGGEIELRLSARDLSLLHCAVAQQMETLQLTNHGWRNT